MEKFPINLTIDTNIFDSAKYNFAEYSKLGMLGKYIEDGYVKLFLTDVVYNETKKHIKDKVSETFLSVKKANKQYSSYLIENIGLISKLSEKMLILILLKL